MEIILAIVVIAAVIFFGALISAGNERQRKAIDNLQEQATLWAMQDLRLKREKLARDVRVDDPLGWLNQLAAKAAGHNMNLRLAESFDEHRTLLCKSGKCNCDVIFTLVSPTELRRMKYAKRNILSRHTDGNPLRTLSKGTNAHEFSVLNSGILFDLELPIVWRGLTGKHIEGEEFLWMYVPNNDNS